MPDPAWVLNAVHAAMLSLLWVIGWGFVLRLAAMLRAFLPPGSLLLYLSTS
jgi:hypothetical protein